MEFVTETTQKLYGIEWLNLKIRLTFLKYAIEVLQHTKFNKY